MPKWSGNLILGDVEPSKWVVRRKTAVYVKLTKILDFNFDHPNGLLACPNGLET